MDIWRFFGKNKSQPVQEDVESEHFCIFNSQIFQNVPGEKSRTHV